MTNSADLLVHQAVLLLDAGDVDGAIVALDDAVQLSTIAAFHLQELRARLLLGELMVQLQQLDEAREHLARVIALGANFTGDPQAVDEELLTAHHLLQQCGAEDEEPASNS